MRIYCRALSSTLAFESPPRCVGSGASLSVSVPCSTCGAPRCPEPPPPRASAGWSRWRAPSARGRPRRGPGLRLLPPGAQPPALVGSGGRAPAVGAVAPRLCPARRAGGGRPRRDAGTPLGAPDRRARDLPRSGPLVARPLRQGERAALVLAHAARAGALGRAGVGPAFPDRVGPVRAARP